MIRNVTTITRCGWIKTLSAGHLDDARPRDSWSTGMEARIGIQPNYDQISIFSPAWITSSRSRIDSPSRARRLTEQQVLKHKRADA